MPFPTVGSWISATRTQPEGGVTTELNFVAVYTTGSSNVEYAIYTDDNTSAFVPYTTANNGSNTISISDLITQDYRVHFRLIGYPGVGFNPIVKHFNLQQYGVGAKMQTSVLGSDVQLSTTNYSKAMVKPYGSYYWNLIGSVSSDGGITWTPVNSFGTEFSLTSTLGSECVVRLTDTTGSVVLSKLTTYFHTSDVR